MREVAGAAGLRLMNLGEQLMLLRGRHLEHEILAVTVQTTEDTCRSSASRRIYPESSRDRFLDLAGYMALPRSEATRRAQTWPTAWRRWCTRRRGRTAESGEWLGDGVMFHFDDPSAAVLTGLDLVEQTPAAVDVRARVGINADNVTYRDGDYFGRTVNVASRIADDARPGEVLVSGEVQARWGGDGSASRRSGRWRSRLEGGAHASTRLRAISVYLSEGDRASRPRTTLLAWRAYSARS